MYVAVNESRFTEILKSVSFHHTTEQHSFPTTINQWEAVAQRLQRRTLSGEPGSNPLAAISKFGQFRSFYIVSVHAAVYVCIWL